MAKTYPDDCIQTLKDASNWWVSNDKQELRRGALIHAFVPHFDQIPYGLEPVARTTATEHQRADVKVAPIRIDQHRQQTALPVAAMPLHGNEIWTAYRAKRRPCLVIGEQAPKVDKAVTRGMPNYASAPTILVAPYYGADKDGSRAGYNEAFVKRIRYCEYPQYFWDKLPIDSGPDVSILRLDQIQPVGQQYQAHHVCDHRLSDEAMEIIDGMLQWQIWGTLPDGHIILEFRKMMAEYL